MADFTYTSARGNTYTRKNDVDYDALHAAEMQKADQQTADYAAGATATKEQYISDMTGAYDRSLKAAREAAGSAQKQTEQSYGAEFDANAASELAAKRRLREQMANYGLGQSGYNATNQTALQIRRANADADTRARKQAAIDSIRQSLAEYEAQVADSLAQKKATASYETAQQILSQGATNRSNATSVAMNRYNIDLSQQDALNDFIWDVEAQEAANAAAVEQARIEAAAAVEKARVEASAQKEKTGTDVDAKYFGYPTKFNDVVAKANAAVGEGKDTAAADMLYFAILNSGEALTENEVRSLCNAAGVDYVTLDHCIGRGILPSDHLSG